MKSIRLILRYTVLLAGLALLFTCNKFENVPNPEMGLNYFPLKINHVVIYNVDSTVYNDFNNTIINFQFQLKDSVTNKFTDAQGNEAYRVERYKKTSSLDWFFQKVITRKIVNNRAEEYIDNKRYVRLVFPPSLSAKWNGNLYNDLEEWPHEIIAINEPLTLGTKQLDSTISISQYNESNLIRDDVYLETYAKNIGLVSKEVKAIEKFFGTPDIKRGYIYTMQLDSFK